MLDIRTIDEGEIAEIIALIHTEHMGFYRSALDGFGYAPEAVDAMLTCLEGAGEIHIDRARGGDDPDDVYITVKGGPYR